LPQVFTQLGIAILLGLLVGMQRERSDSALGGFRTFPLVTILGTLAGLLAQHFGGWVLGAGFLAVVTALTVGNVHKIRAGTLDPGITSEVAMLVMYAVGAYLTVGPPLVAVAVGGGVAVLLQFKPELHGLARRLEDGDVRAIMQFVLIAFCVLPALPDQAYGPFSVLNPREIWMMVVLIVGISLAGYLAYKFMGRNAGVVIGGLLGGVISSTATTVSFARRAREAPETTPVSALVIAIASSVVFIRVLLEVQVVSPGFLPVAGPRVVLLMAVAAAMCAVWWRRFRTAPPEMPDQESPSELKPALLFGGLYAGVLLAVAAARFYLGNTGLYAVAAISGLTDMDAITLSTARLVESGQLDATAGWRMILIATLSNLAFKTGLVATLGDRRLLREVGLLFAPVFAVGVLLILAA
jgi:uncharacterized membrane protein (DUF4010 family)